MVLTRQLEWLPACPCFINCTFEANNTGFAFEQGGAVLCAGQDAIFIDCQFSGNFSAEGGAIASINGASVMMINCTFIDNDGSARGGAVYVDQNSSVMISDCTFTDNNVTSENGGAIDVFAATALISGCQFTGNVANVSGGAINCDDNGFAEIVDCTFINNSAGTSGGAIQLADSDSTIDSSSFNNNTVTQSFGTGGAIRIFRDSSPTITGL